MKHALVALALIATPAAAQQATCGSADKVADYLAKKYGEVPEQAGVGGGGGLVVVFSNSQTGTFTIIVRTPDGKACALAAGEGWQRTSKPEEHGT